jgi:hypothetical protein
LRPAVFELLRRVELVDAARRPADLARVEVAVVRRPLDEDFFAPLLDDDLRVAEVFRARELVEERARDDDDRERPLLDPRPLPELDAPLRDISLLKLLCWPLAVVS